MKPYHLNAEAIDAALARFPLTFGLRAFPGDTFRISRSSSYVNDSGDLQLYTERLSAEGVWQSFARGTEAELRREVVQQHQPCKSDCHCENCRPELFF